MNKRVDFLGQEIQLGDIIVYPGRHGSSLWLNKSTVIAIKEDGSIRIQREDGIIKKMTRLDRVIVVTQQIATKQTLGDDVSVIGYSHQHN
jgi:hypothetical protein